MDNFLLHLEVTERQQQQKRKKFIFKKKLIGEERNSKFIPR
jgi:hypothetical protein